jgi:eukaryotic-like serine/threonine-protein kinase
MRSKNSSQGPAASPKRGESQPAARALPAPLATRPHAFGPTTYPRRGLNPCPHVATGFLRFLRIFLAFFRLEVLDERTLNGSLGSLGIPVLVTSDDTADFELESTPLINTLIDQRYRVLGVLGHGATSEVYLCSDEDTNTKVVLKRMLCEHESAERFRVAFCHEAQALMRIDHPGVLRMLDAVVTENGPAYLVTEALRGEPLADLLARQPLLPTDLVLIIARQLASALVAVHQKGVVHRDVKPDNLFLVGPKGNPFGVKLIDFGMAKLPDGPPDPPTNMVVGTAEYMAPEQVMADEVDGRTDIYSFGILLFRLCTGHLPFEQGSGMDLFSHQVFSSIPPASWLNEELDPRMASLIRRATHKHPDNRYRSISMVLAELDGMVGMHPHSTPPPPPLRISPDIYVPNNDNGKQFASLLGARYRSIVPAGFFDDGHDAEFPLTRRRSTPPSVAPPAAPAHSPDVDSGSGRE